MKTKLLYQYNSYLREAVVTVTRVDGNYVYFNETIFHPRSGGVDHDTGYIEFDGRKLRVTEVMVDKNLGEVAHHVDGTEVSSLQPGMNVKIIIDWERRYRLMRLHTAAHIISAIMYNEYGALVSGGNVAPDYAYDDYTLDKLDRDVFIKVIDIANDIIKKNLEVKIYWLPREEAMRIPGVVKLLARAPPEVELLRIVEIPGVDIQADGGPHVSRTSEIGEIVFLKAESKGKNRRRLYFTVKP